MAYSRIPWTSYIANPELQKRIHEHNYLDDNFNVPDSATDSVEVAENTIDEPPLPEETIPETVDFAYDETRKPGLKSKKKNNTDVLILPAILLAAVLLFFALRDEEFLF